ncbi:hypothetical protein M2171_002631 [Bradyrhizobium japonicum USDA 38]|nr:hypothetical protein [Bradyrhizobium japonicum USDA 38]MCS3946012.1 hypothetical protein [Bradyrhizobium japonicum]MCW2221674.1 hypothetical protein [Bradyrhizobium japonicum]MCW2346287.1 hypothetical protein [Bradyrhizobium japonicum]
MVPLAKLRQQPCAQPVQICATLSYVRDFAFEHGCLDLIRKNREMAGSRDEYALSLWTAMPSGFVPA